MSDPATPINTPTTDWMQALTAARRMLAADLDQRGRVTAAVNEDLWDGDTPLRARKLAAAICAGHDLSVWDIDPDSGRVPAPPVPPEQASTVEDTLTLVQEALVGVVNHGRSLGADSTVALVKAIGHLASARMTLAHGFDQGPHHTRDHDPFDPQHGGLMEDGADDDSAPARCTCRGYDPADPCMHGDTSDGCPVHDPHYYDDSED